MTYNLIDERFLPVQYEDGKNEQKSLKETMLEAHKIVSIKYNGTCHLSQFAMYRLIVVLALDIMRPASTDEILDIYEYGRFDEKRIEDYFCKYREHFDLFSEDKPFMQVPRKYFNDIDKSKKLADLIDPILRAGNNDVFYNPLHHMKKDYVFSVEKLIFDLVRNQMCHSRNGAGHKAPITGGSGVSPIYCLYKGKTLFETTVLGMMPVDDEDVPIWRRNEYNEVYPYSFVNYAFYPSMKLLICDESISKEYMVDHKERAYVFAETGSGHKLYMDENALKLIKQEIQNKDPNTIQIVKKDGTKYTVSPGGSRDPWTLVGTLAGSRIKKQAMNKLHVLDIMQDEGMAPEKIDIEFYGINSGQTASSFRNLYETIDKVNVSMITDESIQEGIERLYGLVEKYSGVLKAMTEQYSEHDCGGQKMSSVFEKTQEKYYSIAKNYFLNVYIRSENLSDLHTHGKELAELCLRVFNELPVIRNNIIWKQKCRNKLIGSLQKKLNEEVGDGNAK